jgi:hypothetical protein
LVFSRRQVRDQGGGGDGLKAITAPVLKTSTTRWRRIAWYLKATRIPFLVAAIYGLGFQQGVMEAVRNPLKLQQGTFETLCIDMGVQSGEDVEIISERPPPRRKLTRLGWLSGGDEEESSKQHSPRAKKVANIGRHIIRAARHHVRQELHEATEKAKAKLVGQDLSSVELVKKLHEDKEVDFWIQALERIEGYSMDGIQNWQYILVGTRVPNAFVTEMLPQRFFVTTGLFDEFIENDDELAMVLGHEISHLILGHLSNGNVIETIFRGLEILILMLDPTEGLLSIGIVAFLAKSREALVAHHSRSNESEADELGIKLAAMACFDTVRGVKVMLKMHEKDVEHGSPTKDLMSSHPPSQERYEVLQKLSEDENLSKYSSCNQLRNKVKRALTLAR